MPGYPHSSIRAPAPCLQAVVWSCRAVQLSRFNAGGAAFFNLPGPASCPCPGVGRRRVPDDYPVDGVDGAGAAVGEAGQPEGEASLEHDESVVAGRLGIRHVAGLGGVHGQGRHVPAHPPGGRFAQPAPALPDVVRIPALRDGGPIYFMNSDQTLLDYVISSDGRGRHP